MGTGGVLVHQGVAHGTVSPAHLHDALTLGDAVHCVQRQAFHVDPFLWMLLQLQGGPLQQVTVKAAERHLN